jgi:hypothetical protein
MEAAKQKMTALQRKQKETERVAQVAHNHEKKYVRDALLCDLSCYKRQRVLGMYCYTCQISVSFFLSFVLSLLSDFSLTYQSLTSHLQTHCHCSPLDLRSMVDEQK